MIELAYCNLGEVGGNYSVFVPKKRRRLRRRETFNKIVQVSCLSKTHLKPLMDNFEKGDMIGIENQGLSF